MVNDIKSPGIAVGNIGPVKIDKLNSPDTKGTPGFGDVLKSKVTDANAANKLAAQTDTLKFSQHAIERMASRGISFKPDELLKLSDAVEKAAAKGSRESLVLMGDNALIVSVKNKTVVTAMDREAMKENVFTNIDSTVIL